MKLVSTWILVLVSPCLYFLKFFFTVLYFAWTLRRHKVPNICCCQRSFSPLQITSTKPYFLAIDQSFRMLYQKLPPKKKKFTKQRRLLLKNFLDTKIANSFPVWYSLLSAEEFQLQKSFSNVQYRKGNFLKDCKYKSLNTKINKFSFPILKKN